MADLANPAQVSNPTHGQPDPNLNNSAPANGVDGGTTGGGSPEVPGLHPALAKYGGDVTKLGDSYTSLLGSYHRATQANAALEQRLLRLEQSAKQHQQPAVEHTAPDIQSAIQRAYETGDRSDLVSALSSDVMNQIRLAQLEEQSKSDSEQFTEYVMSLQQNEDTAGLFSPESGFDGMQRAASILQNASSHKPGSAAKAILDMALENHRLRAQLSGLGKPSNSAAAKALANLPDATPGSRVPSGEIDPNIPAPDFDPSKMSDNELLAMIAKEELEKAAAPGKA